MSQLKSVCLISGGLTPDNLRLQPWRYLFEVAHQLRLQGHPTCVITDGGPAPFALTEIMGVPAYTVPTVKRTRMRHNAHIEQALNQCAPQIILWHLGLPSFLHQCFTGWPDVPVVGIFPGLIYRWGELTRLGLPQLTRGFNLSAMHLLGTVIPRGLLVRPIRQHVLRCLVTQTQTTADRLIDCGLPADSLRVIPPGVDDIWRTQPDETTPTRDKLGCSPSDMIVLYFGSPAPLRGLHTLVRAIEIAIQDDNTLQLVILSRRHASELQREDAQLKRLLANSNARSHVRIINGYLSPQELVAHVSASDIVALPFELVPADAPLSVLEAQALGKPVVTTTVGSLPEITGNNVEQLAAPADHRALSHAILHTAKTLRAQRMNDAKAHMQTTASTLASRSWQDVGAEWSQLISRL